MTSEERLQWWREARFGMFIHWGLYAVLAGEWKGQKTPGLGEWIMRDLKIPISEYEQLAKQFNPVRFDAEAWAELAKEAGMKYLVITAKHHDGFCMFDSPSNPYNIVQQTPFKRDPMKELAAACHKRGIKMCFYYSQDLDWHAPGGAGHWEEVGTGDDWTNYARPKEDFQKYLDTVVKPNLTELLTTYGPIGLIWFDVPVTMSREQSIELRDFVHRLQPACLVSGRVGHNAGDYGSLGDNVHPVGRLTGAWETPATLNNTWGFKKDDHHWKSLDQVLTLLVNGASKGVNYLLNVGPTAEGVIPQPSVDVLKQVGAWLRRNGEAIYGTQASPFFQDPSWGRVTMKGTTLYLLIQPRPPGDLTLYGLQNRVRSIRVLGAPDARIAFHQHGDTLTLAWPANPPEPIISVVALTVDGTPVAEQLVIQEGSAAIELPAPLAHVSGTLTVHQTRGVEGWTDTANRLTWKLRFKTPGTYTVTVCTRCNKNLPHKFGNHDVRIQLGAQSLTGTVGIKDLPPATNSAAFQIVRSLVGHVRVDEAGDDELSIVATRLDPHAVNGLKLTAIELIPT